MQRKYSTERLLKALQSEDADVRAEACLAAVEFGASVIVPLAKLMTSRTLETARSSRKALWRVVRSAGGRGQQERREIVKGLLSLLAPGQPTQVKRETIWMLSEIARDSDSQVVAFLLNDIDLREDARCALQRIPGDQSLAHLKQALVEVPEDFKMNIVQSLRARGVEIAGYPCQKLVPRDAKRS